MCNGAAICRKRTIDTMCPSFQVTRDEIHSTRGRANLLRAAYSETGDWVELANLQSPISQCQTMYEAMDLCIECKACKAECPSSVDMAKIKFEFLAQYYDANGIPLRARLFANIARLNKLGSGAMAPLANWTLRNRLVRAGHGTLLWHFRPTRPARIARVPFTTMVQTRDSARTAAQTHLAKSFSSPTPLPTYTEPAIAIAAVELLEAAGFEVLVADVGDDGRSAISKGLVDKARRDARATVDKLAPFAAQGIPIVGLEPSSLLSLRDEYLYLLPGDEKARARRRPGVDL